MSFGALTAVGACVQIAKTLYEFYNTYKNNKNLLDILEGFTQNLEIGIERLKAREELLGLGEKGQNEALESIERDFTNAKNWLLANDKNLRSLWTALQAADKLKDLDDRLTKAFASKMAMAIFSALQDTRQGVAKIQTTLEGLPLNLETVCRTSTKEAIHEAITELKEEAYQAVGGGQGRARGFRNGEAEKIISQLVDQLAEQERLKEEEEDLLQDFAPIEPTRARSSYSRSVTSPAHGADPFEPSLERASSAPSSRRSSYFRSTIDHSALASSIASSSSGKDQVERRLENRDSRKTDRMPSGSILFLPKDPITNEDLIDPVLANDGLIHDRWSLVSGNHKNLRDPSTPLIILGDVVQLREAIFQSDPDRRPHFRAKRQAYRADTIRLYDASCYTDLPDLINRLSHILLSEPKSISTRIRRGICRYRLRDLENALADLEQAISLSTESRIGENGHEEQGSISLDALRMRALVKEEMHDNVASAEDLEQLLLLSPNDVLGLSLRAMLRASAGDLTGAQDDLARTNTAVRKHVVYRSSVGDSDCDLEFLVRGWAYSSIHDYESALNDFSFSCSLRDPPEPYTVSCRALASIKLAESQSLLSETVLDTALDDLDASIDLLRKVAVVQEKRGGARQETSGSERLRCEREDGLPRVAYQCLLLRASARQTQGEPQLALLDFETSIRLRPPGVRELASLVCALAQIRAECGDRHGAEREFAQAVAIAETEYERIACERAREESLLR
ncbi:uncharacterized protein JCM15063_005732 [Sporobolomyces koalae]|uniref:uncharacterized protein n=1 Tax=Sporobolomyces koalae TaxID=500713 RepID=UPI00316D464A